jgi:hypothetical protein
LRSEPQSRSRNAVTFHDLRGHHRRDVTPQASKLLTRALKRHSTFEAIIGTPPLPKPQEAFETIAGAPSRSKPQSSFTGVLSRLGSLRPSPERSKPQSPSPERCRIPRPSRPSLSAECAPNLKTSPLERRRVWDLCSHHQSKATAGPPSQSDPRRAALAPQDPAPLVVASSRTVCALDLSFAKPRARNRLESSTSCLKPPRPSQ